MLRILMVLSVLSTAAASADVSAATASCTGKVKGHTLSFFAKGSLLRTKDGVGHVKINGRLVARFDGDSAKINYITKSFSIRNDRGDIVEGKVNSMKTGASTLTRMVLPGEGIRIVNAPVKCSVD